MGRAWRYLARLIASIMGRANRERPNVIGSGMTQPRWTGLQDVEAVHREAPRTFSIPRSDQRNGLRPGDRVKLVFEADRPSPRGFTAERMWVAVREARPGGYVGELTNTPSFLAGLQPGTVVEFGPRHVAALHDSPSGLALPFGLYARVSPEIAQGREWPVAAFRGPPEPDSSGWVVLASEEPGGELVPMLVDELIDSYRVLDSILDEPVGTAWTWSPDALEYVRADGGGSSQRA